GQREAVRDHAGRADEQAEGRERFDRGDLLRPLIVVDAAHEGAQHGESVDGGAEREERSGGHDHRAARMSAAPEQHAGEQEYQPYDQPSDQARVRNPLRVLARNRALTPIFHSALRFAAFATLAQRASSARTSSPSASGVPGAGVKPTPSSRSTVA